MNNLGLVILAAAFLMLSAIALAWYWLSPLPLKMTDFDDLYAHANPKPERSLNVFHLGHSLVGRDMPVMLQQLAGSEHKFASQLGWGARLNAHWEADVEIKGYDEENNHPNFRPAHEAIQSGDYDALVLTEGIGLMASIKYYESHYYLRKWANAAHANNSKMRVFLYETWHGLDTPDGWLHRLDKDLAELWEEKILRRALAYDQDSKPIYVIPGGQVFAKFVRYIEENGGVGPINNRYDLFADMIHFNDYGAYLMALTHYAVMYQKSPVGLPHSLLRADGMAADDPGPEVATLMQRIVWDAVTSYDKTGVFVKD